MEQSQRAPVLTTMTDISLKGSKRLSRAAALPQEAVLQVHLRLTMIRIRHQEAAHPVHRERAAHPPAAAVLQMKVRQAAAAHPPAAAVLQAARPPAARPEAAGHRPEAAAVLHRAAARHRQAAHQAAVRPPAVKDPEAAHHRQAEAEKAPAAELLKAADHQVRTMCLM